MSDEHLLIANKSSGGMTVILEPTGREFMVKAGKMVTVAFVGGTLTDNIALELLGNRELLIREVNEIADDYIITHAEQYSL